MKKHFKKLVLLSTLSIIISQGAIVVHAADSNKYINRVNHSNGWNYSNGDWSYFDNNNLKTSWFKDKNGEWYYFNNDGIMQTGWILDNNNWYYLYSNGAMAHNCYIGNYYLNDSGAWTSDVSQNNKVNKDEIKSRIESLGYSSVERIIDYENSDDRYSSLYKYTWYDGKEGNGQYAVVNIFDNGSTSILLRKNGTMFNENLKNIFDCIVPGNGQNLLNEIDGIKEDKNLTLGNKNINIKNFDDSIGIIIE